MLSFGGLGVASLHDLVFELPLPLLDAPSSGVQSAEQPAHQSADQSEESQPLLKRPRKPSGSGLFQEEVCAGCGAECRRH